MKLDLLVTKSSISEKWESPVYEHIVRETKKEKEKIEN